MPPLDPLTEQAILTSNENRRNLQARYQAALTPELGARLNTVATLYPTLSPGVAAGLALTPELDVADPMVAGIAWRDAQQQASGGVLGFLDGVRSEIYDTLKGTIRGVTTGFDTLWEEGLARPLRATVAGYQDDGLAGAWRGLSGGGALGILERATGTDLVPGIGGGEAYYDQAGASIGARALQQFAGTGSVNLGSGWFPNSDLAPLVQQALVNGMSITQAMGDPELRAAQDEYGTPVTQLARHQAETGVTIEHRGHTLGVSPGRLLAVGVDRHLPLDVAEPGTLPFNILSGAADFAAQIFADPSNALLAPVSAARKTAKLFDPGTVGALNGVRRSVFTRTADEWLDSRPGQLVIQQLTDTTEIADVRNMLRLGGNAVPGTNRVLRQLADSRTTNATADILRENLGITIRESPVPTSLTSRLLGDTPTLSERLATSRAISTQGAFGRGTEALTRGLGEVTSALTAGRHRFPTMNLGITDLETAGVGGIGAAVTHRLEGTWLGRMFTQTGGGFVTFTNPDRGLDQLDNFLNSAGFHFDDTRRYLDRWVRNEPGNIEGYYTIVKDALADFGTRISTESAGRVNQEAIDALTEVFDGWFTEYQRYFTNAIGQPEEILGNVSFVSGGERIPVPTAMNLSEFLDQGIPLPDARMVRRAVSRISNFPVARLTSNKDLAAHAYVTLADNLMSKIWKPLVLLRVAFPVRVVGEEQARMAGSGLDSAFRHPISYMAYAIGGKGQFDALGDAIEDAWQYQSAMSRIDDILGPGTYGSSRWIAIYKTQAEYTQSWLRELNQLWSDDLHRIVANHDTTLDEAVDWLLGNDIAAAGVSGIQEGAGARYLDQIMQQNRFRRTAIQPYADQGLIDLRTGQPRGVYAGAYADEATVEAPGFVFHGGARPFSPNRSFEGGLSFDLRRARKYAGDDGHIAMFRIDDLPEEAQQHLRAVGDIEQLIPLDDTSNPFTRHIAEAREHLRSDPIYQGITESDHIAANFEALARQWDSLIDRLMDQDIEELVWEELARWAERYPDEFDAIFSTARPSSGFDDIDRAFEGVSVTADDVLAGRNQEATSELVEYLMDLADKRSTSAHTLVDVGGLVVDSGMPVIHTMPAAAADAALRDPSQGLRIPQSLERQLDRNALRTVVEEFRARNHVKTGGRYAKREVGSTAWVTSEGKPLTQAEYVRYQRLLDQAPTNRNTWVILERGDDDLLNSIATGRFEGINVYDRLSKKTHRQVEQRLHGMRDRGPAAVKGIDPDTVNTTWWDRAVQKGFNLLGSAPTDKLSRSPAFKQFYWNRMMELTPYLNPEDAVRMWDNALAAGIARGEIRDTLATALRNHNDPRVRALANRVGTDQSALRQLRVAATGEVVTLEDADELAKAFALNETRDLLYDIAKRRDLTDAGRNIFPFAEAWAEIWGTWARIFYENPETLRRFQQGVEGARDSGFFYEDPNTGEEKFSYPGGGLIAAMLGFDNSQASLSLEGRVTGLNLAAGSFLPGFGPVVQFPAAMVMPDKPEWDVARDLIFPFGKPNIDSPGDIANTILPAYAKKWLTALNDSDPDQTRLYNNTVADVMKAKFLSGQAQTDYDLTRADEQARFVADAKKAANVMWTVRGFAQFMLPTGPEMQFETSDDTGKWWLFQTLASEWNDMNKTNGFNTAQTFTEFTNRFGVDPSLFATSKSRSLVRRSVTDTGRDFERANPDLFEQYKLTAYYALPDDPRDEFDYDAYLSQFASGTRVALDPDQWLQYRNQLLGNLAYSAAQTQTDNPDALRVIRNWLMDEYPGYRRDILGGVNRPSRDDKIAELYDWANEPRLNDTDAGQGLALYLEARDAVISRLPNGVIRLDRANSAAPHRAALTTIGQLIAQEHPGFAALWDGILASEVREDDERAVTNPEQLLSSIPGG